MKVPRLQEPALTLLLEEVESAPAVAALSSGSSPNLCQFHKRSAVSATIKLPGPASGLRSMNFHPLDFSHPRTSSSL